MGREGVSRLERLVQREVARERGAPASEIDRLALRHVRSNAEVATTPNPVPPRGSYAFALLTHRAAATASVLAGLAAAVAATPPRSAPEFRVRVSRFLGIGEYPCSICLKRMTRTQVSVVLPCFHRFCYTCIYAWFKRRLLREAAPEAQCVLCRSPVEHLLYLIKNDGEYCALRVRDWFTHGDAWESKRFRVAGLRALAAAHVVLLPDARGGSDDAALDDDP